MGSGIENCLPQRPGPAVIGIDHDKGGKDNSPFQLLNEEAAKPTLDCDAGG
jgi:hypothetical protein